jgi:hypothetical protein
MISESGVRNRGLTTFTVTGAVALRADTPAALLSPAREVSPVANPAPASARRKSRRFGRGLMVEKGYFVFGVFTPVRLASKGFLTTTRLVIALRSPAGILGGTGDEDEALP